MHTNYIQFARSYNSQLKSNLTGQRSNKQNHSSIFYSGYTSVSVLFWIIQTLNSAIYGGCYTFLRSRIEPLPRIMILQPVICSICLVVMPRGPRIRPTKLNCSTTVHTILLPKTDDINNRHQLWDRPIDHIKRLARPSAHVCPPAPVGYGLLTRKRKGVQKPKLVGIFPRAGVSGVPIFSDTSRFASCSFFRHKKEF